MATLTIRNIDEEVKRKLRIRGAENNRSMEAEAREILRNCLLDSESEKGLASTIQEIVAPYGGIDLKLPDRKSDTSDKRLNDLLDE